MARQVDRLPADGRGWYGRYGKRVEYKLRQGLFHMLMYCPTYGDMIEDKELRHG